MDPTTEENVANTTEYGDSGDGQNGLKPTPKKWNPDDYFKADPEAMKRRMCELLSCPPDDTSIRCQNLKCTQKHIEKEKETYAEREAEFLRTMFDRIDKVDLGIVVSSFSIIFLVGVIGNILIIIVTLRGKGLTNSTNIFITSMAVADILVLLVCLPVWAMEYLTDYWIFGRELCKTILYVRNLSFVVSVLHLICMCLDRYLAICHPMKAKLITTVSRARVITVVTWIIGGAMAAPTAVYSGLLDWGVGNRKCVIALPNNWRMYLYRTYYLVVVFVLPICVLSFAYGSVIRTLLQSIRANAKMKGGDGGNQEKSGEKKKVAKEAQARFQVVKMLVTVMVVFSVCWCPSLLWEVVKHHIYASSLLKYKIAFSLTTIAYANSSLNPAIYFVMSKKYRQSMVALICCRKEEKYMEKSAVTRESNVSSSVNSVTS